MLRSVEEFNLDKAVRAIELFNKYYGYEMDPMTVIKDWDLEREIHQNSE